MTGTQHKRNGRAGLSRLESVLLLAIVSLGLVGAYVSFEKKATEQADADVQSAFGSGATNVKPVFSSRVLTELAKEKKNFAQWMAAVQDGTATNDEDWIMLEDEDGGTNSPEFIARSRMIAAPGGVGERRTNVAVNATVAGGSVASAGAAAGTVVAGESATSKKLKSSKPEKLASKMTEEQLKAKTEAGILKKLTDISAMPWSPQAESQLTQAIYQWAKIDPAAAMNYAMSIESRRARVNAVNNVLSTWASKDPGAAQQWFLANMPQDPLAASATVRQLYGGMGMANMSSALQTISQLPTAELQSIATQTLMAQIVRSGDETAIRNYYQSVTDPKQRDYLARGMASTWAAYQPAVAAEWISKISNPLMYNQQVALLASTWAFDDAEGASVWAASLADQKLRYTTMQQTTRTWAKEDPVAAADWVLTLNPPSPQADPAISGLVGSIMTAHPEGAMAWANSVNDPNVRISLMKQVGRVWMAQNPSVASLYIHQSNLPLATKNWLLATTVPTPPK